MKIPALVLSLALCAAGAAQAAGSTGSARHLPAFADEREFAAQVERWADTLRRRQEEQRRDRAEVMAKNMGATQAAPAAAPATAAAESVTNVQHAGVDEGGIVKVHGDHLVVLRRGRLFTVAIRAGGLAPVHAVDAYAPGIDPRGAWYDEMLLWGDTVVVIGYSYARGGTEIGLFDIGRDGRLAHRATHHLRSNDYYSSRNYAGRLVGSKLVFYTPLRLDPLSPSWRDALPAQRRWAPGASPDAFRRIAPATRIHRVDEELDPLGGIALHTVSVCDLANPELQCESTAVLGQAGRVFYASPSAVYVWTGPARRQAGASAVFRLPLDGQAPTALKASGSPIDQMSFLEGEDGMLNVLVRAQGTGDGMWSAEARGGDLALLRVPVERFSDGRETAPREAYRVLPRADGGAIQNRYVGDVLLYGAGAGWRAPGGARAGQVHAVRLARADASFTIDLPHRVDRIEALGRHALVVGASGPDLHFTSVRLSGVPVATGRYVRPDAAQGETRTHGFFYKPEDAYDGLVGLPIVGGGQSAGAHLRRPSASVLFLRNRSLELGELGALEASPLARESDGCRASCVDWYGNSRPLFLRNRVFALMGYEIVEGRLQGARIEPVARTHFAPMAAIAR